jgi:hypothetical protein
MGSTRLPRFRRVVQIAPIALTDRDRALIGHVSQHRFLRSTHLLSLVPGSRQQLLRRLQLLYHHGYLDRPRLQIDYYRAGSRAMVYGLGNKGMKLLQGEATIRRRRLDWDARNRMVTRFFMEHTLAVADAMVALELSCRKRQIECLRVRARHTLKWTVSLRHEGVPATIGVVPDAVFGLKSGSDTRWFFLEADRATMPVERTNLKQTSFFRKLLAYHETWRQKLLSDSLPRFQVLTVTTTRLHMENLLRASQQLTHNKGSGLFLFIDRRTLVGADDVLQLPFLNGRGEKVLLLS